jgi:hypothetical protein
MAELKGVIQAKSDKTGGIKIDEVWYTCAEPVKPYLAKMNKGDAVTAEYKTEKYKKIIVKLMKDSVAAPVAQTGPTTSAAPVTKSWTPKTQDPDTVERITRGNAINAAAAVLAGRQEDPDTLAEMVISVAEKFVIYIKG